MDVNQNKLVSITDKKKKPFYIKLTWYKKNGALDSNRIVKNSN